MNKQLLSIAAVAAFAFSGTAFAAAHKEAPGMGASAPMAKASAPMMTKQQSKMGTCNKDAEGKRGDERKAFMKECLSAEKMSQQDKMKKCNVDATGKKGGERKTFMKECLSA